ncbi:MAG: sulfur carrier protein ThiS [Candidatus Omnitrophica bacterium]|nr:sulfur carrier protein ThiS [Candidatus Omnitrophota bacterium]
MKIRINGKEQEFEGGTLLSLVESKELIPDNIVIEYNLSVVEKDKWAEVIINESDNIEIISFVGGG